MTKRIAIQLFGHLRTFEHTFDSFKQNVLEANQLDGFDIDIFIHTWNQIDHNTISYRNNGTSVPTPLSNEQIELVKKLYKPKKLSITQQVECEEFLITEKIGGFKRSIKGCVNMAFSQYSSAELRREYEKEQELSYDYVLITRPDILFKMPLKINTILNQYEKFNLPQPINGIYFAYNPFRSGMGVEDPRFIAGSDLIYFARPQNIDEAMALYENLNNSIDPDDFYCFEVWQMRFWQKQGLEPIPVNYLFVRDWLVLYKEMLPQLASLLKNEKKEITENSNFKKTIYFMGIPIFKIKRSGSKTKYYLLSFIPILYSTMRKIS